MKHVCKWCNCEIEITQSEKAKNGLKKLFDHEAECFKQRNPNFESIMNKAMKATVCKVPDKFNMQEIIKYLHESLGKIPSEDQCLRFNMFLQSNPSGKECEDFVKLLKVIK